MMQWFDMGHHTLYVWLAYGVSTLALISIIWSSLNLKKKAMKSLIILKKRADLATAQGTSEELDPSETEIENVGDK
jgi:heme exporter protein CcmD